MLVSEQLLQLQHSGGKAALRENLRNVSGLLKVSAGVPQGSILRPFVFTAVSLLQEVNLISTGLHH